MFLPHSETCCIIAKLQYLYHVPSATTHESRDWNFLLHNAKKAHKSINTKNNMFAARKTNLISVAKSFVRGKKVQNKKQGVNNASTQRVVNQLSALSASKKQPKLIKLCPEDLIKHKTITNAWKIFQRRQREREHETLVKQHESIYNAMEELKKVSPDLFQAAQKKERKFFPLEFRVPTDYPARNPWSYEVKKAT